MGSINKRHSSPSECRYAQPAPASYQEQRFLTLFMTADEAKYHGIGRGIITAVEEVFPGMPDFIYHFHFLRDMGKDLLLTDEATHQKRLQNHYI
jgi:hypothetical protein